MWGASEDTLFRDGGIWPGWDDVGMTRLRELGPWSEANQLDLTL